MKKVSVNILNYNGKKFIKDCVSSVFRQNYKNFEVVFIDNNSKDGSLDFEALKKDAQKRIQKLIKSSNVKELISKPIKKNPSKTNKKKKTSKRYFSNTKTTK